MFSLIISIISIALVAAIAVATIFFGGNAFKTGSAAAQAAETLNATQQINGAGQVFINDKGRGFNDFNELVSEGYLKGLPRGDWALVEGHAVRTDMSEASCLEANKKLGINTVPQCSDPAYADQAVCCSID